MLALLRSRWCFLFTMIGIGTLLPTGASNASSAETRSGASIPVVSLDFGESIVSGIPRGWFVEGDESKTQIQVRHGERGTAFLNVRHQGDEPALIYTVIPAHDCDKAAIVSFELRSSSDGAAAGVLLRPSLGRPLFGQFSPASSEWQTISFEVKDKNCLEANMGAGMLILGDVEVRKFALRRSGKLVSAPTATRPTLRDKERLAERAHTIEAFLDRAFASGKRVVALGEASHGAAGLFALKFETIKAAARRDQAAVFALEMPVAAGEIVDDYIQGRSDDLAVVIDALTYPAWQTEEMIEIVEWLRMHNRSARKSVRFSGFDIQHPIWAARALMRLGVARDVLTSILQQNDAVGLTAELSKLEEQLNGQQEGLRYMRLLRHGLIVGRPELEGAPRATYMADEVMRIAEYNTGTIFLWADNTHVSKAPGSMGARLKSVLGDQYLPVGMTFAEGEYSAYGPRSPYAAEAAYSGTHEAVLASADLDGQLVFLSDFGIDHPLRSTRAWRFIGSKPEEFSQFLPHRLADHFDAIGFVELSESTTFLREHHF